MFVIEDPVRIFVERVEIARSGAGKTSDDDAALPIDALLVFVLPGDVVARAGRQDVDFVPGCETFGNEAA